MNLANLIGTSGVAIAITSGLTQSVKTAFPAVQDRFAYLVSVGIGILVAAGLDYATLAPATPQAWTLVILHGLVVGLSASGLYKTAAAIAAKAKPAS